MSTFDGNVAEFPDIRIDYFRSSSTESRPALAYFLSHVHSDHLVGLESCRSPFIYCSPATRDILLRLEKYPHRMNFAKSILETRKQTYRHLKSLLKAIPLDTPTVIELSPSSHVRVTLFDANHCVGAVVFLIEGDGKAILYTGDIRSEPWWVNSLIRHPALLPYVSNTGSRPIARLDCLYLDTTFVVTGKEDPYASFPSKADGLQELLRKVSKYPKDTLFYLDAWTFGYEEVWQALSMFLGSSIHVDDYKYRLYRAVANGLEPKDGEASKLIGFYCGNHFQRGFLSAKSGECRIHSCERGTGCDIWSRDFVRVTPIVSRHDGMEIAELGAGGGQGDLNQQHELEVPDAAVIGQLMALCASKLHGQKGLLSDVLEMLSTTVSDRMRNIKLEDFNMAGDIGAIPQDEPLDTSTLEDFPLDKLVPALVRLVTQNQRKQARNKIMENGMHAEKDTKRSDGLPRSITFPYSRHSSYKELCQLVETFKPGNIYPCTVEEKGWTPSSSMGFLFGHLYDVPTSFSHDQRMLKKRRTELENVEAIIQPSSPHSATSEYATPSADVLGVDEMNEAEMSISARPASDSTTDINGCIEALELPTCKRKRENPRVDDDRLVASGDHSSPSKDITRHRSTPLTASDGLNGRIEEAHSGTRQQPSLSVDKRKNRLSGQIVNSNPSRSRFRRGVQSSQHLVGRPQDSHGPSSPSASHGTGQHNAGEMQSSSSERPRSYVKSSPAQDRLNVRQHIYESVSDKAEAWSRVDLVSVSGHQCREEEL